MNPTFSFIPKINFDLGGNFSPLKNGDLEISLLLSLKWNKLATVAATFCAKSKINLATVAAHFVTLQFLVRTLNEKIFQTTIN